jgi:hypothetical protein
MNVLGTRAALAFGAEPDIRAWANEVPLNPAAVPSAYEGSAALDDALDRLRAHTGPGLAKLASLADGRP